MSCDNDPSEYKEKKWGKDNSGEYIINGYVFRGEQRFKKAVDGLKRILKKGSIKEIEGIEFKVLDVRVKGNETIVEIEMDENSDRGIAVAKLFETNKKKENVVMISKSKASDAKFVIILAEQIIKPLMKKFIMEDGSSHSGVENQEFGHPSETDKKEN